MIYREVQAHPKLRDLIKCFWVLEHDYSKSVHDHERLWADAYPELIFTSGERYVRKTAARKVPLPSSVVIGPFQNELELHCAGKIRLVAARFQPWGLHPFCKIPMPRLRNAVMSSRQTFAADLGPLAVKLAAMKDIESRIAALQEGLLAAASAIPKPKLLSRPLASDILKSEGLIRINELSARHRLHARQVERIFLEETGVRAKVFARIIRFNRAKTAIEHDPEINLLTLAHDCGYADQSHFTRNFREMFGFTPSQYKARIQRQFRLFQQEQADVAFVQDNPPHAG